MRILLLIALFALTVVHLFVKHDTRLTKPLLLPVILAYYIVSSPKPSVLLILALAFSWLGDVLLMPHGDTWFAAGGIAFMTAHFLFIAVYAAATSYIGVCFPVVIAGAAVYITVSFYVYRAIRPKTPRLLAIPMLVYLLANSAMNTFALIRLTSVHTPGAWTAFVGAVLFFISDCSLFLARNSSKHVPHSHQLIMGTYVLGEFLIAQGMLL